MLHTQVSAIAAASRQVSTDLAKMQHHQDCAEKSAYTALRDIHRALDGVRSEAFDAISLARYRNLAAPKHVCMSHYTYVCSLPCLDPRHMSYTLLL